MKQFAWSLLLYLTFLSSMCFIFLYLSWTGLTFKEKWNTSNVLFTEIAIEDQLVKGLKLEFNTSFAPQTGYSWRLLMHFHISFSYNDLKRTCSYVNDKKACTILILIKISDITLFFFHFKVFSVRLIFH